MMEFFNRYKKVFLVVGFIFISIGMGYILYSMFFKPSLEPITENNQPANTANQGGLPNAGTSTNETGITDVNQNTGLEPLPSDQTSQVANGGLTAATPLTETPGLNSTLSSNGSDVQYYDKNTEKFYSVDKNGNISTLSDKVFHDVSKVTWSPDKTKAIIEYPDAAKIVYNFNTQKQVTLPSHWKDFDYSSDGKQIVMKSIGTDPDNRWLAVANDDGSNAKAIEPLGEQDDTVYPSWSPNKQVIALYTEGKDFNRQTVYFVGLHGENFKSTVVEGRGLQSKWSEKGDTLLYSVYSSDNDMKPTLWTVNAEGDTIGKNRKKLNLDTWADKCSFVSNTEAYCAVPEKLEEGAGIFPELAKNTKDRLYKINTATGLKSMVAIPNGDFSMSNLIVSDNGYNLYFTDDKTEKIYKIKLK